MNSVMSIIESRILATNGGASAENITIWFELLHNSEEQRHFFPSLAFAKHTSKGSPEKDMEFFFSVMNTLEYVFFVMFQSQDNITLCLHKKNFT